ncbi:hypothetical protein LMG28614_02639 [Paraburkholderia ultramafica]|uniref:Uncharacterized protein n=1 Tax=Paraburkholderia ultramafica TaxID=1544867 RepID=A0A6S7BE90_9BURK|nr:hypothetical protein LMG28614_02639 [Paraburkholderia ultramafica]
MLPMMPRGRRMMARHVRRTKLRLPGRRFRWSPVRRAGRADKPVIAAPSTAPLQSRSEFSVAARAACGQIRLGRRGGGGHFAPPVPVYERGRTANLSVSVDHPTEFPNAAHARKRRGEAVGSNGITTSPMLERNNPAIQRQ